MDRRATGTTTEPLVRSRSLPLLAGYLSFGRFWGFWVILVREFQRDHGLSEGRVGLLYSAMPAIVLATVGITVTGLVRGGPRA